MCSSNSCATAQTANANQDALTERVFHASIQTLEVFSLYLGKRLGLYDSLAGRGAQTPPELAFRFQLHIYGQPQIRFGIGKLVSEHTIAVQQVKPQCDLEV